MRMSSLISALFAAAAFAAAPAVAKTSIGKSKKICEAAAQNAEPAPKFVIVDTDQMTSSDKLFTVKLKVKNADDSMSIVTCKVDRSTGEPTLQPAS
jgi:hypothetical protein